jgi:alpha-L-fucosidase
MTINDTWGYKTDDTNFKSAETLLHNLIDIASKGGNYLLNVGPTSLGEIPQPEVDRLTEIGRWLAVNGQAIYGSTASPFRRYTFDGRCTVKDNRLFVHVFHWPSDGIQLTGLKTRVTSAVFLDGGASAEIQASVDSSGSPVLTIRRPVHADPLATVVVLDLVGPPEVDNSSATVVRAGPDGSLRLIADDASIDGSQARLEGDHIGYWTDASDAVCWVVASPTAGEYEVQLIYACDDRAFGSQYRITAGDSSASGTIRATGGWNQFVTEEPGRLRLTAGANRVTVRATAMPRGAVMNLREVRLTPLH